MEKRRPHYRLADVQEVVADPASQPFTATALRGGLALGLTEPEMRQVMFAAFPTRFLQGDDFAR